MKKKYKIIIGVILAIILVNISWYLIVQSKYKSYVEKVPKNEIGVNYIKDKEGYQYNVKIPDYFSLTGNLAVTQKNDDYALIIWPQILNSGEYEYGVTITQDDFMHLVEVDETFKPIGDYNEDVVMLVNDYKEKFEDLLNRAKNMWGI